MPPLTPAAPQHVQLPVVLVPPAVDAAYESTGGGTTWKKVVDKPKGGAVMIWSYDPVGNAFHARTGSIFCYAR